MKKHSLFPLPFLLIIFLFSCSNNSIIPADEMKVIAWDMLRADEMVLQVKDSTLSEKEKTTRLYEQVFAVHQINKERFYTSTKYYISHPDLYKTLTDSVKAYGTRVVETERLRLEALQAIEDMKMHAPHFYTGARYEQLRDTVLLNDRRWDYFKK